MPMYADFPLARLKHITWKMRLRSFLKGEATMSKAEVVSAQKCQLGKWLYAQGLKKYGHIPEMQQLERIHRELHAFIELVLTLKAAGRDREAEQELTRLEYCSDELLLLLDAVEKKIN